MTVVATTMTAADALICGQRAECIEVCPVVRLGKPCPGVAELFAEFSAAGVDPWPILTA